MPLRTRSTEFGGACDDACNESATLLPGLLCGGVAAPVLAVCALAIGARLEFFVVLSRTLRQSDQFFFRDRCHHFRDRADLVYPKRGHPSADSALLVGDRWNAGRRCIVWIAVFSFRKADGVGPNNSARLTS